MPESEDFSDPFELTEDDDGSERHGDGEDLRPLLRAIFHKLAALEQGQQTIMTALTDLATQEGEDTTQLINDIEQIQTNQAQAIKDAVTAALAQANADDATTQTVLQATDAAVTAEDAKLQAVLHPAPPAPVAPTITSPNPLSVPGGSAVTGQVTVSAGTIAGATSADGAISMDASGNLSGTAGASGGSTTLAVAVTNSDGTVTDLSLSITYA